MLPVWLLSLFATAFAIGTDDLIIAGVLPTIASDLGVSEAAAGQLVTVFSVTYALGAPVMALAVARLPRRTVLLAAMVVFVVTDVLAALAPSYPVLMLIRVVSALSAATITPISFGMAAELAPPQRQGRYLGIITSGLTVSLIVGVPLGTWVGGVVGWRASFLLVAGLGALATVGAAMSVPAMAPTAAVSLRERLRPLRDQTIGLTIAGLVLSGAGGMMIYVYLAPISAMLAPVEPTQLALLIATFGVFGVLGTTVGGAAADRIKPQKVIGLAFGGTALFALLLLASTGFAPLPLALVGVAVAAYGFFVWSVNPPVQVRLLSIAGNGADQVLALNVSALYLGFTFAGALGGVALGLVGIRGLLATSVALLTLGLVVFGVSFKRDDSHQRANRKDQQHADR